MAYFVYYKYKLKNSSDIIKKAHVCFANLVGQIDYAPDNIEYVDLFIPLFDDYDSKTCNSFLRSGCSDYTKNITKRKVAKWLIGKIKEYFTNVEELKTTNEDLEVFKNKFAITSLPYGKTIEEYTKILDQEIQKKNIIKVRLTPNNDITSMYFGLKLLRTLFEEVQFDITHQAYKLKAIYSFPKSFLVAVLYKRHTGSGHSMVFLSTQPILLASIDVITFIIKQSHGSDTNSISSMTSCYSILSRESSPYKDKLNDEVWSFTKKTSFYSDGSFSKTALPCYSKIQLDFVNIRTAIKTNPRSKESIFAIKQLAESLWL